MRSFTSSIEIFYASGGLEHKHLKQTNHKIHIAYFKYNIDKVLVIKEIEVSI